MIISKIKSVISYILSYLILFTLFAAEVFAADIESVRLWRGPDHTRLVFDLSAPVDYEIFTLQNPERLVIDIANSTRSTSFVNLNLSKTPILKIRSGIRKKKNLRIVLDLTQPTQYKNFVLGPNKKYGDRLVVDLAGKAIEIVKKVPEAVEKVPEVVKKVPELAEKVPEIAERKADGTSVAW